MYRYSFHRRQTARLLLGGLWLCAALLSCERTATPPANSPHSPQKPANTSAQKSAPQTPPKAKPAQNVPALEFLEFTTGNAKNTDKLPLIVGVHGMGDNPQSFSRLLRGLDFPARVIIPRGPTPHGRGARWFASSRGNIDREDLAVEMKESGLRLAALLQWLPKQRPTLGKPVVLGFSQGGMLSFLLAIEHGETIGAAFPLAGTLPRALWPTSSAKTAAVPICALHGDADRVLPLPPTQKLTQHLLDQQAHTALTIYPGIGHSLSSPMKKKLYQMLRTAVVEQKPSEACKPGIETYQP